MKSSDFEKKKQLPNKWFIIPIILLASNFIYKLIDQSKLIFTFPLGITNDLCSYIAQLFFLAKCGFYKFCPYWYNGFISFKMTPPAWFVFTLPIYWLTNNITLSTYLSMILIFILIFITIYFFGKLNKFSNIKIIAFFLFVFANAMAIGNFVRLGRVHEFFGWLWFIIVAFMVLWYKDKKITKKFYLIIIPLSLAVLSHQYTGIPSFIMVFSLFLSKRRFKDKIKVALTPIIALILTSFWWVHFFSNFKVTYASNVLMGQYLFNFGRWFWQNTLTFIIPVIFGILFYFYWISKNKSKKELLFFITPLIIAFLIFSRLIYFVPILRHVFSDAFILMFIFLSVFMFFKLDLNKIPSYIKKLIPILLILITFSSIYYSIQYTPLFQEYTSLEIDTLEVLNKTDGQFLILKRTTDTSFPNAYYSYAPIYLNLTTPDGWYYSIPDEKYLKKILNLEVLLENKECTKLIDDLTFFNTTSIIVYDQYCSNLEECGLKEKYRKNRVCLFELS